MDQSSSEGFKDPTNLTVWAKRSLYVFIIVSIMSIVSGLMEYNLLKSIHEETYTSQFQLEDDADASDRRQQQIGILLFLVFIVSGILILRWIYRACYNARQLSGDSMTFTPGWSVGWYFIPIMNLWKPYQAMKEIWDHSHIPDDPLSAPSAKIVQQWWAFWLIAGVVGNIYTRLTLQVEELPGLMNVSLVGVGSNVLWIMTASALLRIIDRVYQQQMANNGSYLASPVTG